MPAGPACTAPATSSRCFRTGPRIPRAHGRPGQDPGLPDRSSREIEAALPRHPTACEHAAVAVHETGPATTSCSATSPPRVPDGAGWTRRRTCAARWPAGGCPDYMVPAARAQIPTMPADRRRQAGHARAARAGERTPPAAPRHAREQIVAEAFAGSPGPRRRSGLRRRLLRLGGHSLLATRLVARTAGRMGVATCRCAPCLNSPDGGRPGRRRWCCGAGTASSRSGAVERPGVVAALLRPAKALVPAPVARPPTRRLQHPRACCALKGPLDVAALEAALGHVVGPPRDPCARSSRSSTANPYQQILCRPPGARCWPSSAPPTGWPAALRG